MLTCKTNKGQTYLIARETTSAVHLKVSRAKFCTPVCQLNAESRLTEFQGYVLPGNETAGRVLQGESGS